MVNQPKNVFSINTFRWGFFLPPLDIKNFFPRFPVAADFFSCITKDAILLSFSCSGSIKINTFPPDVGVLLWWKYVRVVHAQEYQKDWMLSRVEMKFGWLSGVPRSELLSENEVNVPWVDYFSDSRLWCQSKFMIFPFALKYNNDCFWNYIASELAHVTDELMFPLTKRLARRTYGQAQ